MKIRSVLGLAAGVMLILSAGAHTILVPGVLLAIATIP
jgi:hypothetical protein